MRASALIEVLEGAGVAAPATRATLDRLVQRGLLARERRGREILFSLTDEGGAVLREATERVRGPHPFEPHGTGWTLVTFTVPEDQRTLRHRLRSALTWEGFAPLRDGLWLAPGEVDLAAALEPLRADLPAGAITAFHAREAARLRDGRQRPRRLGHRRASAPSTSRSSRRGATWRPQRRPEVRSPPARCSSRTGWRCLRADPRLPRAFMDDDWPAPIARYEVYWGLRNSAGARHPPRSSPALHRRAERRRAS